MRKTAAFLLCTALLWGCSDIKTDAPIEKAPAEAPTESPTFPEAGICCRFDPEKLLFAESDLSPLWKQ